MAKVKINLKDFCRELLERGWGISSGEQLYRSINSIRNSCLDTCKMSIYPPMLLDKSVMAKVKKIEPIIIARKDAWNQEWYHDGEVVYDNGEKLDLLARLVNTLIDEVNKLKEGGK
ncbi:hypothetical protein FJY90_06505 [Candidatus Gottesmanbacteria bacterium]|nr:hypothetical protein [Candidatus Gottesmanbacteria bacterium]